MSEKLKVVGAKALANRPVLRVIRGDEDNSSPPTTPDPSWLAEQVDCLDDFGEIFLDQRGAYPQASGVSTPIDEEVDVISINVS